MPMNEAVQTYNQTVSERKVLGRSAHHKKNGSAVSKLGNKPMSWQEINSKHGECKEFDLGCFMDYDTFKKMAPDLEAEYVNKLCNKYGVRISHISEHLFHAGENDLMSRLKIVGVYTKCKQKKTTEVSEEDVKNFTDDISLWEERSAAAKIVDLSEATRRKQIIENAEFIPYDEFASFSNEEKVSYLNSIIDKYDVSLSAIERDLFQFKFATFRSRLNVAGILGQIKHGRKSGNVKARNEAFKEACDLWRGEPVMSEPKLELVESAPIEAPKEEPNEIARDILLSIVGEPQEEPSTVEPEAVVESAPADIPAAEPKFTESETLGRDILSSIAEKTPEELYEISGELITPKVQHIENKLPLEETEPKASDPVINSHATVFTSNYKSIGLDSDELDGLKLLFKNKQVEVCITVRTI